MERLLLMVGGVLVFHIVLRGLNKEHRLSFGTVLESIVIFTLVFLAFGMYYISDNANDMLVTAVVCSLPIVWKMYSANRLYWAFRHYCWRSLIAFSALCFGFDQTYMHEPRTVSWALYALGVMALVHLIYLLGEMVIEPFITDDELVTTITPTKRIISLFATMIICMVTSVIC